jgi:hypothetical protein
VPAQYFFRFQTELLARQFVHLVVSGHQHVALLRDGLNVTVIDGDIYGQGDQIANLARKVCGVSLEEVEDLVKMVGAPEDFLPQTARAAPTFSLACVRCGHTQTSGRFCTECGAMLVEPIKLCNRCGAPFAANALLCTNCSTPTTG